MHLHRYCDWTKLKSTKVYQNVDPNWGYLYTKVTMVAKCSVCSKPKFKTYKIA